MKYTCMDDILSVIAPNVNNFINNEKYVNTVLLTMRSIMLCPEEDRAEMAVYAMDMAYDKFVETNGIKALKAPLKDMFALIYNKPVQHDTLSDIRFHTIINDIDNGRLTSYGASYKGDTEDGNIFSITGSTLIWNGERILELVSERIGKKIDVYVLEFLENWAKTLSMYGMKGYDNDVLRKTLLKAYGLQSIL